MLWYSAEVGVNLQSNLERQIKTAVELGDFDTSTNIGVFQTEDLVVGEAWLEVATICRLFAASQASSGYHVRVHNAMWAEVRGLLLKGLQIWR